MVLKEIAKVYGGDPSDWRRLDHGAVAHRDASVGDHVCIQGPAVFRGGEYHGGTFYGGEYYDGAYYDGLFHDGTYRGGVYYAGEYYGGLYCDGIFCGGEFREGVFRGGEYHGGLYCDGEFCGGTFHGGVYYGGTFYCGVYYAGVYHGGTFSGGVYRDGVYRDGVYRRGILIVSGALPYTVNIAGPDLVAIGSEVRTLNEWEDSAHDWAADKGLSFDIVDRVIQLIKSLPPGAWPEPVDFENDG